MQTKYEAFAESLVLGHTGSMTPLYVALHLTWLVELCYDMLLCPKMPRQSYGSTGACSFRRYSCMMPFSVIFHRACMLSSCIKSAASVILIAALLTCSSISHLQGGY